MIRRRIILAALTFLLAGAVAAMAQEQKADAPEPPKTDSPKKPVFIGVGRVSTDEALANVARQKAANKDADSKAPAGDAVLEFHDAPPSTVSPAGSTLSKDSKIKSPLKDLHGEAHGLAGTGANQEGGKMGGKSKDGKTAIYVETNHSETSNSH